MAKVGISTQRVNPFNFEKYETTSVKQFKSDFLEINTAYARGTCEYLSEQQHQTVEVCFTFSTKQFHLVRGEKVWKRVMLNSFESVAAGDESLIIILLNRGDKITLKARTSID